MSLTLTAKRLWQCNSGASIMEFAIVGPIFLYLLMAIIEYSLILFADATLESSMNVAAREAKTGSFYYCSNATNIKNYITNITTNLASGIILTPGNLNITETTVAISDSQSLHNYTATYVWVPFTPMINYFFGGKITLTSTILLNDEIIPPNPILNGGMKDPNAIISFTHTLGKTSGSTFIPSYYGCN